MIVVIMQPTYLSWSGYFDMMDNADVFVLLDTVQFEKQAWQQRNRIKITEGQSKWLTVPVVQNLGQKISDVQIKNSEPWSRKHWGTIEQFYKQTEYWKTYKEDLAQIYLKDWDKLAELNIALINFLKEKFNISTKLLRASQLQVSGEKVRLLVDICHDLKADVYMSTPRAADYLEHNNIFAEEGIALKYHQYEPSIYRQLHGKFLPYMSALDLLLNEGPRSLEIIRSGRIRG
ncbi:MAG: WbqC family protein [PVC group bacterium]|nr:WbqC family protein [PVC group bacterium]